MHKVKYRISEGETTDAFIVFQDGSRALVYSPKNKKELASCSSLSVCKFDRRYKDETWVNTNDKSWLNIDRCDKESRNFDNMIIKMISEIKE